VNTASKIVNLSNTLIINPFSIQFDSKVLNSYKVNETFNEIKSENIGIINYLYSVDSSVSVHQMNNGIKPDFDPNYSMNLFRNVNNKDVLPLVYIDKDSFKVLKLKLDISIIDKNSKQNYTPVYAGYDYKPYFKIGDIINGNSGKVYKIVGFLGENKYMFGTNTSDTILSYYNNLNSFLVIPYDFGSINETSVPLFDKDSILHYRMINTIFKYKSEEEKKFIEKTLSDKKIEVVDSKIQIKKFSLTNFNFLRYKIFNSLIITLIALIGIISYVIASIYSEKREIGIMRALGFSRIKIIKNYILKVLKLIFISVLLTTIIKEFFTPFYKISLQTYIPIVLLAVIIISTTLSITTYYIFKFKIVDLEINSREVVAIMGASGCGKSTLMNIIGLIDKQTKGNYFFDGEDSTKLDDKAAAFIRNRKIGFVYQYFALIKEINILENVMLPLNVRKLSKNQKKEEALKQLKAVGLEMVKKKYPFELSGGQQQRVAIARALAQETDIILADEPTGNLDRKTGCDIIELLVNLNNKGKTIIIITHDDNIAAYCNRKIKMNDGKIISDTSN